MTVMKQPSKLFFARRGGEGRVLSGGWAEGWSEATAVYNAKGRHHIHAIQSAVVATLCLKQEDLFSSSLRSLPYIPPKVIIISNYRQSSLHSVCRTLLAPSRAGFARGSPTAMVCVRPHPNVIRDVDEREEEENC